MQEFLTSSRQDDLLTLAEASAIMGVSKITLRRWTASGSFPCVRIGSRNDRRFRAMDIRQFILAHMSHAPRHVAKEERADR